MTLPVVVLLSITKDVLTTYLVKITIIIILCVYIMTVPVIDLLAITYNDITIYLVK